jgi:hypothetical protein
VTRRLARILRALAVDADLLRRRRELRLLVFGQATSLLGSMITLVAIPVTPARLLTGSCAVRAQMWQASDNARTPGEGTYAT